MKLTILQPIPTIANNDELDAAIADFEQLDRAYGDNVTPEENRWLFAYRDEIDRYERAAGHCPDPPETLAGILEVEMFRHQLREQALADLLGIAPTHLSGLLRGKRKLNLDLARRLHQRLGMSAEVLLNLAA